MPFEDGRWEEGDEVPVLPGPSSSASLGSTSGPGEAPGDFVYDEDRDGRARSDDQGPHPEIQTTGESAVEDQPVAAEPSLEPLPTFDERVKQDFEGLMYLGYLEDEFTWAGHRFRIRTLYSGEIIEAGLLHKPYRGSLADAKAYQAAIVAACTVSVDGHPMPIPITNEPTDTALRNRFNYVMKKWFPPTLDAVYEQYLLLESRVLKVLDAMGKAPGSTQSTRTLSESSA